MSEIKFSNFVNEDGSHGPDLVGVTTFTSPHYFVPPSGTTAQRPSGDGLAPGTLRFNTDIGRLEVWRGDHWATILGQESSSIGGRALFGGGYVQSGSGDTNVIEYVTIQSTGNSIDFGDLSSTKSNGPSAFSSKTRGIFAGGYIYPSPGTATNVIDYVTIATTGNALDFGDLTQTAGFPGSCSDSTRGIIFTSGGAGPYTNVINYVTMTSTGNASDFGDILAGNSAASALSSPTRGVVHRGGTAPASGDNTLEYITIQSTGNSVDFGDLAQGGSDGKRVFTGSLANSIRGVFFGGTGPSTPTTTEANCIQYLTISTTGNTQDFGDLTIDRNRTSGTSDATRGIMGGGNPSTARNSIEFITISTTGNGQDFGDFSVTKHSYYDGACSNAHGGL